LEGPALGIVGSHRQPDRIDDDKKGLRVRCGIDTNEYEKGIRVSKKELEELNISRHEFHGEWNYWVSPSETSA